MMLAMDDSHRQQQAAIRLDWGAAGAAAIGAGAGYAIVVDVLSFSTTVSVALDLGAEVFPYRWRDASAAAFAREHDATLAVGRAEAAASEPANTGRASGQPAQAQPPQGQPAQARVSLSPASVRSATRLRRLVLPSPNGSSLSAGLADGQATVLTGAFRNRTAIARWLTDHAIRPNDSINLTAASTRHDPASRQETADARHRTPAAHQTHPAHHQTLAAHQTAAAHQAPAGQHGPPAAHLGRPVIAIVAAGERWPDGSLRPAIEDFWGAGAIVAALSARGWTELSPEAAAAEAAFAAVERRLPDQLAATASGRELTSLGFAADLAIAAELDASATVPLLSASRYADAARNTGSQADWREYRA